jgi:hypothetical protein
MIVFLLRIFIKTLLKIRLIGSEVRLMTNINISILILIHFIDILKIVGHHFGKDNKNASDVIVFHSQHVAAVINCELIEIGHIEELIIENESHFKIKRSIQLIQHHALIIFHKRANMFDNFG